MTDPLIEELIMIFMKMVSTENYKNRMKKKNIKEHTKNVKEMVIPPDQQPNLH